MKHIFAILLSTLLCGCATGPVIDRTFTAIGQDSRAQFLIIHYTVIDFPMSLKVLTQQQVSSHYLVRDNPPEIYQLVDDNRRAYHAGLSSWKGQGHINAASIGIEIVNPGFTESPAGRVWYDYPPAQIDAVIALVKKSSRNTTSNLNVYWAIAILLRSENRIRVRASHGSDWPTRAWWYGPMARASPSGEWILKPRCRI